MVVSPGPFLVLSAVALAGMATANVLLPSLVKLHFPDRVGTVTALYTTAMAIGLTCSLLLTVPVAEQFGGWRVGLGVWAALALLSALPWLLMAARSEEHTSELQSLMRISYAVFFLKK